MGWCRDFGCQIAPGCTHLMRAGSDSCHCDECGVVCPGRFEACPSVWAQGPQPITLEPAPASILTPAVQTRHQTNGSGQHDPDGAAVVTGAPAGGDELPAPDGPDVGEGSPAATGAGRDAVRGLQDAFAAFRLEVHGLREVLTQNRVEITSLVERHSENSKFKTHRLRPLVDIAVREAMQRETADLKAELAAAVTDLRHDVEAVTHAQEGHVSALQASIQSLVDVVAESVAQSDAELRALGRRLDLIAESEDSVSAGLAGVTASLAALAATSGGARGTRVSLRDRQSPT